MNIKQQLEFIYTYYVATRGKGHSRLLNVGTDNYRGDKFVLCATREAGDRMRLRRSEIVTLKGLDTGTLRGHDRPMAIDNSAFMVLFDEAIVYMKKLEMENSELRIKLQNTGEDSGDIIEDLKAQLKRETNKKKILATFLKMSIAENEERKAKIEEMEKHPFKTFFNTIFNGNISKSTSRRTGRNEGRGSKSGSNKVDGGRKVRSSSGS